MCYTLLLQILRQRATFSFAWWTLFLGIVGSVMVLQVAWGTSCFYFFRIFSVFLAEISQAISNSSDDVNTLYPGYVVSGSWSLAARTGDRGNWALACFIACVTEEAFVVVTLVFCIFTGLCLFVCLQYRFSPITLLLPASASPDICFYNERCYSIRSPVTKLSTLGIVYTALQLLHKIVFNFSLLKQLHSRQRCAREQPRFQHTVHAAGALLPSVCFLPYVDPTLSVIDFFFLFT
jgi:hypothetical protein